MLSIRSEAEDSVNRSRGGGSDAFPDVLCAQEVSIEASPTDDIQAAALGFTALPDDFSGWLSCLSSFLFFVVLMYLVWILWKSRSGHDYTESELSERRKLFFFVGSLLSILIAHGGKGKVSRRTGRIIENITMKN